MIRINLLPFRAARKTENVRRQATLFALSVILVIISIVYMHIKLQAKIELLTDNVDRTQKELESKKSFAKEVDRIKKELETLKKKKQILVKLDRGRKSSVNLLDSMTQMVIRDRMWFQSLEKKKAKIKIIGYVLDNKTAADFMTRIEESGRYGKVNLKMLKQKKQNKKKLQSFEISFIIKKKKSGKNGAKK
jgi:type IV pilus assembly protein PilN